MNHIRQIGPKYLFQHHLDQRYRYMSAQSRMERSQTIELRRELKPKGKTISLGAEVTQKESSGKIYIRFC